MTSLDIDELLGKLDICDHERKDEYVEQLQATEFFIFKRLSDLGCFAWSPKGSYKPLSSIKSDNGILCYMNLEGKPDCLKSIEQIVTPKRFMSPSHTTYKNKFPYGDTDIISIHVAVKVRLMYLGLHLILCIYQVESVNRN